MRGRSAKLVRLVGLVVAGSLGLAPGCGERAAPAADAAEPAVAIDLAPLDDRERSPYTGWTRAHYQAVFARLLLGFVDHRSPAGARTRYPGGEELPAAMEGATRMLPALGAWLACPCNPARILVDGRELDVAAIARAIVVEGTDPRSPDYWGRRRGPWDQRIVEAASVAEFLVRSRARVWARLTPFEQRRIMTWLEPAEQPLSGNWLGFQIAGNAARRALGYPVPEQALPAQLDALWANYGGDGLFRDSESHRYGWYNAFVIHALTSFWRSLAGPEDGARVEQFAAATRAFVEQLPYLFDAQGRVAPIGRSLAYRSAVLAGLHASLLAGDEFIEPGLARRISAGNLRFHLDAGMFGPDQVLTRGYHGEQPELFESYLRPGSQYFFAHALSVLALPPDHEFWTAPERPLPADAGDFVHAIAAPGWLLSHDADGAGLILHNAGTASANAKYYDKYSKLDYSAQSWYGKSGGLDRSYDSLVIVDDAARFGLRRLPPDRFAVAPGFAWTRYAVASKASGDDPHRISTATLHDPGWTGGASLRLSCVEPGGAAPIRAYEGSHALALGPAPRRQIGVDGTWMVLDSGAGEHGRWGAGAVLLAGLFGWERVGEQLDQVKPAAHVLGGPAGYVGLSVGSAFTQPRCFASLQALAAAPFDPEPLLAGAPTVSFAGTRARVEGWVGTRVYVELAREPAQTTVELGPIRATGPIRLLWVGDAPLRAVVVGADRVEHVAGELLDLRERDGWIEVRADRGAPAGPG